MRFKYIFFDFNGTILDDVDLCLNLLNEMLESKNLAKVSKERYLEIFTFPVIDYYKKAGFTFDGYSFEELASYFIKKYQPASLKCQIYDGLLDLLEYLKEQGYNLIVLSASRIDNLKEQLDYLNLTSYFKDILGTSDIYAKTKLGVLLDYLNSNKIDPSTCLFIGDTLHDYEIAKKVNSVSYLVDFGHQSKQRLLEVTDNVFDSYQEIRGRL